MRSIWSGGLSFSLFGESHGRGVGITVHGLRAGIKINREKIEEAMRRRHGLSELGSSRVEADEVQFLSGLKDGYTTGAPLTLFIENRDVRSSDYKESFDVPRPSHSDYVNRLTNGSFADVRGGGHFSGRLTAPLVALAGFLREEMDRAGLRTLGHISQLGPIKDEVDFFTLRAEELRDYVELRAPEMEALRLPMLNKESREEAEAYLRELRAKGDSIGARCEIVITGLPAGLGEPYFEGLESRLGALLFSLPGVKAVEFGLGAAYASHKGSEVNDAYCLGEAEAAGRRGEAEASGAAFKPGFEGAGRAPLCGFELEYGGPTVVPGYEDGPECEGAGLRRSGPGHEKGPESLAEGREGAPSFERRPECLPRLETRTNYGGGISGGISTGVALIVSVTFRPTPSIGLPQRSVSLSRAEEVEMATQGRHDACIALKGLRAMDATLRLALAEYLL